MACEEALEASEGLHAGIALFSLAFEVGAGWCVDAGLRDRDPVEIDGKVSNDEPSGLPLEDSFVANLQISSGALAQVTLRNETIVARPSKDLSKDLPIVDFLW